jgi:gliding motility-associated-like protein
MSSLVWAQSYFLNGDAGFLGGNCYLVTPNIEWQNGTIWYSDQLDLTESFSIEFDMYFGTTDGNGADGMAFVLQTVGTAAIGSSGGGMGYQGFDPSFGIEFDTYCNPDVGDPNYDHVAFLRNGNVSHYTADNLAGPVGATAALINLEDGQDHQVKITWNPAAQTIALYVDCELRLSDQVNLVGSIFQGESTVYWGFTGATGGLFNEQRVCLDIIVNNAPNEYSVCEGEQVQLLANGSLSGAISWTPAQDLDDPTSFEPIATPTATTDYCYTYTDFCGNATTTCTTVEVLELPEIVMDAAIEFCENEDYLLAPWVSNASAITWNSLDGNIVTALDQATCIVDGEGSYQVIALNQSLSCADSLVIDVVISQAPSFVPQPLIICPGETVLLSIPADLDLVNWWDGSQLQPVQVNQAGSYEVEFALGNCFDQAVFEVEMVQVPTINLGSDTLVCLSDEPYLLNAGVEVSWNTGETAMALAIDATGNYAANWSDGLCSTTDEVFVEVIALPQIELSGPSTMCSGDSIILNSNIEGQWIDGVWGITYTIYSGGLYEFIVNEGLCQASAALFVAEVSYPEMQLGPDLTSCNEAVLMVQDINDSGALSTFWNTAELETDILVNQSGMYYCTVSNACGSYTDSIFVTIIDCETMLYAPNAFTPNGDGINDEWNIHGHLMEDVDLKIFDRWGLLVFTSRDLVVPWLGQYLDGAHFVCNDNYHFIVDYTDFRGNRQRQTGVVSVIR